MTAAQGADGVTEPKSAFAARCNVTPGRVSQWISEGKITADALEGEGPRAKVRVDVALAQLNARIDVGQRFGNGLKTRLRAPLAPTKPAAQSEVTIEPVDDGIDGQIKRAKLSEIEFRNREAAKKELASRGDYVRTQDVRSGYDQVAVGMVNVFEGALTDFAQAIAAEFQVPQRDVLHLLRREFRKVRETAAQSARRSAADLPGVVEDLIVTHAEAA